MATLHMHHTGTTGAIGQTSGSGSSTGKLPVPVLNHLHIWLPHLHVCIALCTLICINVIDTELTNTYIYSSSEQEVRCFDHKGLCQLQN